MHMCAAYLIDIHSHVSLKYTYKTGGVVISQSFGIAKGFHGWISLKDLIFEGTLGEATTEGLNDRTPDNILWKLLTAS